jgi:hypothetical protein
MRIAVMIIGLCITVLIGIVSFATMTFHTSIWNAGFGTWLIAILSLIGSAFVLNLPRVSRTAFGMAAVFGSLTMALDPFKIIWAIVTLSLAILSQYGCRESVGSTRQVVASHIA